MSYRVHRIVFVSVLTLSDVVYATIHCITNGNKEPKIHITAHVAGALSGVLLGFIFYQNRDEDLKFKILKWISLAIYLGFVMLVTAMNVMHF